MKKQSFTFLLTILASMMGVETFAHDIAVANADGVTIYYTYINNNTELAVTYQGSYSYYYNEYTGNVVIPESVTYNGTNYSVTSIGDQAFYCCSGLTSVTIPNSVTNIGSSAFGETAWYNNQPDGLVYAGKVAYRYKGTMPSNTSIILEEGTLGIAGTAFYGCTGLTNVTIPNSVTSIGKQAFSSCSGLTSVTIPNSVTNIGESAFSGCSGLTEVNYNATNCTTMGTNNNPVFAVCSSLTTVNIGKNVQNIPEYAFYGCSGLKSITIPNSVITIGSKAFGYCSTLESVTFGTGVLSIGSNLFNYYVGGHRPAKVIWLTNTPPSGYSNAAGTVNYVANEQYSFSGGGYIKTVYKFLSSTFEVDGVKYVPVSPSERTCDAIDCMYEPIAENLNIGETVEYKGVKMKVSQVHPYACYNNQHIKDVKINCSGDVGNYAFYNCEDLQTVEASNGGKIGIYAFSECSSLNTIKAENKGAIGNYAFYNCTKLSEAQIANTGGMGLFYRVPHYSQQHLANMWRVLENLRSAVASICKAS